MSETLWELANDVNDALDFLRRALDKTSAFLTDQHSGEPLPWKEMGETALPMRSAVAVLETALEPIREAIEEEAKEMDRLSDLADGQSY